MRGHWDAFLLWRSQYRLEIRRMTVALLLFVGAMVTGRAAVAWLVVLGTVIMFLLMKYSSKYIELGQAMMDRTAVRKPKSELRGSEADSENEPE